METDLVATNWVHLQDLLFRDTWDEDLKRYRSAYVYRGLSDKNYDLVSSLIRLGGIYDRLERHLLRNFIKYARRDSAGESLWNWLVLAQHHGLPTRLIDWTYSPLVALHFATANPLKYNDDGVIWCVNYVKANQFLPQNLLDIILEEGSNVFTPYMLDKVCNSLHKLSELQSEPFNIFLEPPSLDERIVNQHALSSLMSTAKAHLGDWLQNHPDIYFRIIIPAELKWEIRDKLDQSNITERVLFPGLDGLSMWLKRHYSPKDILIDT